MRLNGGVIGASNQPTNRVAPGVWSAEELRTNQLYGRFPRYYEGWSLRYISENQPNFIRSLSISATESISSGIHFSDDGIYMYIIGTTGSAVDQHTLGTAWDISTATYTRTTSFTVTSNSSLRFKPDGTKLYICESGTDTIREYTLGTAWDISTASFVTSFSISAQGGFPSGLAFSYDGTTMYTCASDTETVYQYTLSTAWDISTASYSSKSLYVLTQENSVSGIIFKIDGTKLFITGPGSDYIHEYHLSTAWDISTATIQHSYYVGLIDSGPIDIYISPDGLNLYTVNSSTDLVYQFELQNAWSVETVGYEYKKFSVVSQQSAPTGLTFKTDGTSMYTIGITTDAIDQYDLSIPWDITSSSYIRQLSIAAQETQPAGLIFNTEGTKMYHTGSGNDRVYEYGLSTAWDISSATFTQFFAVGAQETVPNSLTFKPDGTRMYVIGQTGDDVNEYHLSTAWDISTASYIQIYSVAAQETVPKSIYFNSEGTRMFMLGSNSDRVFEYTIATPWDISTASYSGYSFSLQGQGIGLSSSISFRDNGVKMYVLDQTLATIFEYNLG